MTTSEILTKEKNLADLVVEDFAAFETALQKIPEFFDDVEATIKRYFELDTKGEELLLKHLKNILLH